MSFNDLSNSSSVSSLAKILIVDDERDIREGLATSLRHLGYQVTTAQSGEEALFQMKQSSDIGFVLTDFKMPGLDGLDVIREFRKNRPQVPVVMMTGFGNVHHAVNAMQMGAKDYLCKPFRFDELERILVKALPPSQEVVSSDRIITSDPKMIEILTKAKRVATSFAPVLIEGPSGTGKELLAREIHNWSNRRQKPWVAINCAALPGGLLESELFGYEKGAFTGANDRKIGKFEQADGGTLLLDEIGELDPLLQAKLLRVLQEGEVDRLGGKRPTKVDVRVIATTNRSLSDLVRKGLFREDLYFRLYGVRFEIPALDFRKNDIDILARNFLEIEAEKQARSLSFGVGVIEELQARSWNGNVRELERAIERAAIFSTDGIIEIDHFDFEIKKTRLVETSLQFVNFASPNQKSIRDMEREIILNALEAHSGNRTHTAKALGMSLRTLRHKLKNYREEGVDIGGMPLKNTRQIPIGKNDQGAVLQSFDNGPSGALKPG